ncbi:uncharacterized protein TNCV_3336811 [Trichonephila clavipes]|nr:uncharacterized protein TNCV_3336811 [Trichonephila clavipes]
MDEILTTARDLELEVNEDNIEELIMGHKDELMTEELQEILNEEHQETQRIVSPSEQAKDERGPLPTSTIKDLLKKWADVRAMVLEWHPNQTDVSRGYWKSTTSVTSPARALYQNTLWDPFRFYNVFLTHFGAPIACGSRIIDTADTVVATPLQSTQGTELTKKGLQLQTGSDGLRNFQPRSSDQDDASAGNSSPTYHTTLKGGLKA